MSRSRRTCLGTAIIALLSGCQAIAPLAGASNFQLGALVATPSPQAIAVAAAPQPEGPAASPSVAPTATPTEAPHAGGGSSRRAAPAAVGTLTVDVAGVAAVLKPAAQRRVLATAEDIDRLIITIKMEGQPDLVQEVSAAELQAGNTSVSFTALPTGTCTVTIEALDAAGTAIGRPNSRMAPIAQSEVTDVSVRILIIPDDGVSYSYADSFVFGVDLEAAPATLAPDGSGPVSGTVMASFPGSGLGGLYADGAGHLYARSIMISPGQQSWSGLDRISTADGSDLKHYMMSWSAPATFLAMAPTGMAYDPVHEVLVTNCWLDTSLVLEPGDDSLRLIRESLGSPIAVDGDGDAYYILQGILQKATQTETTPTTIQAHSAFVIDRDGNFWVNGADVVAGNETLRSEIRRFAPDGTLLGTYALPFPAARIISDGEGGVWVNERGGTPGFHPWGQVVRVAADGTVGVPIGVTASDFCIDAQHILWVAGGPMLLKLAPDGTQLGSYPIKARTITFGDGYIFAGTEGYPQSILKIVP